MHGYCWDFKLESQKALFPDGKKKPTLMAHEAYIASEFLLPIQHFRIMTFTENIFESPYMTAEAEAVLHDYGARGNEGYLRLAGDMPPILWG